MRLPTLAVLAAALTCYPAAAADPSTDARAALALAVAAAPCDCPETGDCVCRPGKCPCKAAKEKAVPVVHVQTVTVHLAWDGRSWSRWENGKWVPHVEAVAVAPPAPVRQAVQPAPTFLGGGCAGGSCGVPSYGGFYGLPFGGFGGGSCGPGGCR